MEIDLYTWIGFLKIKYANCNKYSIEKLKCKIEETFQKIEENGKRQKIKWNRLKN